MERQTGIRHDQNRSIRVLPDGGFCYGVRKAVSKALAAADRCGDGQTVYTLGEIVHNPIVVRNLKKEGIMVADEPEDVPAGAVVIIRSHGVPPEVIEEFERRGVRVVDATCPKVRRVQRAAEKYRQQNWPVVVVGRQDHPEVRGVLARCGPEAETVNSHKEAQSLPRRNQRAVLFQTTFDPDLVGDIAEALRARTENIKVEDTLCHVVSQRRKAVREMVEEVDALVVVGGKNSSNTSSLMGVGHEAGIPCYHVETAKGLPEEELASFSEVAVVGGTSTPQDSIDSVSERLLRLWADGCWSK